MGTRLEPSPPEIALNSPNDADLVDVLTRVLWEAVTAAGRLGPSPGASFLSAGVMLAYDAAARLRTGPGELSPLAEQTAARVLADARTVVGLLESALAIAARIQAVPGLGSLVSDLGELLREADGDEFDITVRLPMQGRQTLTALDFIEVASSSGRQLPLR